MIDRKDHIKCDDCGQFIKLQDIMDNKAFHYLEMPDSDLSKETWVSSCAKCLKKELK